LETDTRLVGGCQVHVGRGFHAALTDFVADRCDLPSLLARHGPGAPLDRTIAWVLSATAAVRALRRTPGIQRT
jgi:hypothetical protein